MHCCCRLVQIVPAPALLLVDEPTSGLDSSSSLSVMGHLRGMALAGHTIVTAIHQPRQEIWNMFDKVGGWEGGRHGWPLLLLYVLVDTAVASYAHALA